MYRKMRVTEFLLYLARLKTVPDAEARRKIFRVGLLMFGKPPGLRTLGRWVRMA